MKIVKIPVCQCLRCSHKWIPRGEKESTEIQTVTFIEIEVVICPKCKSPLWDKPKQERK